MKSSSATRIFVLPVGDEDFVGALCLLDHGGLFGASLLVVVGRARQAVVAAPGWRAGGEFELAAFVGDQAGPGEGVVLVLGDQMPGQHGHLPCGRDDGLLEAAACLDPLVERAQRPGCPAGRPRRFNEHAADVGPAGPC